MRNLYLLLLAFLPAAYVSGQDRATSEVPLADPFVLYHNGVYYAYGTGDPDGIEVYLSDDLLTWRRPDEDSRLALHKDDVWGEKWFWAPEVYFIGGTFYMYYSAEEHICAATADSPLGPFRQTGKKPMLEEKSIDNSLFIDRDGKGYLFFDLFEGGLQVYVAELTNDLLHIVPGTITHCIGVSADWEAVLPQVNEGAYVFLRNDTYYMTYSANGYTSPHYGIGFATAPSVRGPWTKYEGTPIYQFVGDLVGVGHSAMFTDKEGNLRIAFHAHKDKETVHPRGMYISTVGFRRENGRDILVIDPDYITPRMEP